MTLAEDIQRQYAEAFAGIDELLGPVGSSFVRSSLRKVSLTSDRSVHGLAEVTVLADLAGRGDVLVRCADIVAAVPFTGDRTQADPLRAIQCGAVRRAELAGRDVEPYRSRISLPESGVIGPPSVPRSMKFRVAGGLYKAMLEQTATTQKVGAYGTAVYAQRITELWVMWAFGGSRRWSRSRIDEQIEVNATALREIRALR